MSDPEIGDALLKCSERLRQLAADLPGSAEIVVALRGRELHVSICLRDSENRAYEFGYRLQPGEAPDFDRSGLAKAWEYALQKLKITRTPSAH